MSLVNVYEMLNIKKPKRSALDLPAQLRCIIVSPSGGGKSQLVVNLLDEICDDYDQVIFVVKTPNEPLYSALREKVNNPEWLRFVEEMPDMTDISPRSLIILDDQILEKNTVRTKSNYQNNMKLFTFGRKINATVKEPTGTSCFYLTQNYSDVPQQIKKNSNVVMFKNPQASDLMVLKRDLELGPSKERAKEIFAYSKRDWIVVDKEEPANSEKRMFIFA